MSSARSPSTNDRARTDVGVVDYGDELVIFRPEDRTTHIIGGGGRYVWRALEAGPVSEVVTRVADAVRLPETEIADDVLRFVDTLRELNLVTTTDC